MNYLIHIQQKIIDNTISLNALLHRWRLKSQTIVFTNGCFDIIHQGHIINLAKTAALGNKLIVGLNSDASIRRLKGAERPIQNEASRALVLAAFQFVNAVVIFNKDTPLELITQIQPDVLVKGGDYQKHQIIGAKEVESYGGRVAVIPLVAGFSTTNIVRQLKNT